MNLAWTYDMHLLDIDPLLFFPNQLHHQFEISRFLFSTHEFF